MFYMDIQRGYLIFLPCRLDSTLGDFREMKWSRGDVTFIFNGEDNRTGNTLSMVVLDNEKKEYQRMKLLGSVSHLFVCLFKLLGVKTTMTEWSRYSL